MLPSCLNSKAGYTAEGMGPLHSMYSKEREYLSLILSLADAPVYLVGGTVRDLVLKAAGMKDIDIVMQTGSSILARRFADAVSGSFFFLDQERGMSRVIRHESDRSIQFDFADFIGPDLHADLGRRDFTMNAMAVELGDYIGRGMDACVIDPFLGREDIQSRTIRVVRPDVLDDDPLRLLRAVRFSAQLGFTIEHGTAEHIRSRSHLISGPAPERIRDELFQIFSSSGTAVNLSLMDSLGMLLRIFPELAPLKGFAPGRYHAYDVLTHSIKTADYVDGVVGDLPRIAPDFADRVRGHLEEPLEQFVDRKAALRFACLLHDIGKPETFMEKDGHIRFHGHDSLGAERVEAICQRLRLSRATELLVTKTIRHHMRLFQLATPGGPSRHAMFRYCRDLGADLPESIVLALADSRSTFENMPAEKFLDTEKYAAYVLEYYYARFLKTEEKPLVTGKDLIELGFAPGPRFGKILDEVKERLAEGAITTREEALSYIEKLK